MLGDDEDVFDSVTWESAPPIREPSTSGLSGGFGPSLAEAGGAGPGFRQSADDDEGRDPNEPHWEGYLRTAVRDPTKELAETKDAYVSYLVTAEVSGNPELYGASLMS
jgi:sorting nexin-4